MKRDLQRIILAMVFPLFLILILYIIKVLEVGMEWNFVRLGIFPLEQRGIFGIFAHPLIHSNFTHLLANTLPLFFLSWCLFYFYRGIGSYIFFIIWVGCGIFTFLIGKPGWHIGASGIIYGLAFFLFFSGLLRKYVPLVAISLLVTFLYGGLVWQMFPNFTSADVSWEGHLSGAIMGTLCALGFMSYGPQRPEPFKDDEEEEIEDPNENTMIRKARPEDASAIAGIYNYYVLNTAVTFETDPVTDDEMKIRILSILEMEFPFYVAEIEDKIIGYCYIHTWNSKRAYSSTQEVTIYLENGMTGKGIGKQLFEALLKSVDRSRVHVLISGICLPNESSVRLHEKYGFKQVSCMKEIGRKLNRWQDVGHWQLILPPT